MLVTLSSLSDEKLITTRLEHTLFGQDSGFVLSYELSNTSF